jgi:hypothetical protein
VSTDRKQSPPGKASGDQRRAHDRFEARLPVTVLHSNGTAYTGETRNVSLGGMLIAGEVIALPFGTSVVVRVQLPALSQPSEIPATVRWIHDGAIGVQFGSLRANQQWALNQLLKG